MVSEYIRRSLKNTRSGLLAVLVFIPVLYSVVAAGVPLGKMNSNTLAMEYVDVMSGQVITEKDISSNEHFRRFRLQYAPVSFLLFSAGIGADKFTVDEYNKKKFNGSYGFSSSAGIMLFTPLIIRDIVRVKGGLGISYLNSRDKLQNVYEGIMFDPYGGIGVSLGKYAGIDFGFKGHIIDGAMRNADTGADFGKFSNRVVSREYASLILKSPGNMTYMTLNFEVSPEWSRDWNNGPYESAVGLSVGVMLRRDTKNEEIEKKSREYFPDYDKIKEKADELEEDVQ